MDLVVITELRNVRMVNEELRIEREHARVTINDEGSEFGLFLRSLNKRRRSADQSYIEKIIYCDVV